jgi:2,3-bisphosphoglycerate-independent phosphoglycerate mutase
MSKGTGQVRGPVVLVVLDGWGYRPTDDGNAILLANTPTWDQLVEHHPTTLLDASGRAVGLPEGQMGNSEVGHMNLGAGRVVPQDTVRISDAIESGAFYQIPELVTLCEGVKRRGGTLHLLGLVGTGGVHASHHHWVGTLELARRQAIPRVAIHAFLDGRDTPPKSAAGFVRELQRVAAEKSDATTQCRVATLCGRYYAMDRDRRWPRTKLAYDAMVHGTGERIDDPVAAIEAAYDRGKTDEFLEPMVVRHDDDPMTTIRDGDGIFTLNFRADCMRQIVRALAIDGFAEFDTGSRPEVDLVTMTQYDATFPFPTAFPPQTFARMVAEVLSDAGRTQFRTAETEKYAHVTYFFNCGVEVPFKGEERVLVDSQQVATYDLKPEMSAPGITDVLCPAIEKREHDFILCNYANGDMVGHTGVLQAAVQAVEAVDRCLARVMASVERAGTTILVTADHGNCEVMIDPETGGPHTAHTTNPVPLVVVGDDECKSLRRGGRLSDVGPTVLRMLGLEPPSEMTGRDLRAGTT